jgi:hypothetical protein|tara:strand:+ start:55 stop:720 length:666 start_codon:yes stop_codon:yes gene_type:complete
MVLFKGQSGSTQSPHLDPKDYTPHEPPGWNEYIDDAFVAPAGSPYFLPQDSSVAAEQAQIAEEFNLPFSSIDANLRPDPPPLTQEEKIINGIWPLIRTHAPQWSKDIYRNVMDFPWGGIKKGLHDTGKMFYDKGTDIDKWIFDMFGWSPNEDYYGQPRLNELDDLEEKLSQSQWRRPENIEKTIDVLEIRPEFEGWSRDEIKAYIFRSTQQVNRGGIIGLI